MSGVAEKLVALGRDVKLSHTVFAMPFALLAAFMAAGGWPHPIALALVVVCMICARTLGMGMNRLLDANLDAANPRTVGRAIPSGRLSLRFYVVVIALCAVLFQAAAAGFYYWFSNPWPMYLAIPVLAYLAGYPLMKRFTRLCHYYLGLALGLAPVCAWVAIAGRVDLPAVLMCLVVLCWTAGFDILYACQDYQSDLRTGTFSVPAKFGIGPALWIARGTHALSWALLVLLWWNSPHLHVVFAAAVLLAAALLIYEHSVVKPHDLSKLNMAFFTLNGIISATLGLCGIVDVVWASLRGTR